MYLRAEGAVKHKLNKSVVSPESSSGLKVSNTKVCGAQERQWPQIARRGLSYDETANAATAFRFAFCSPNVVQNTRAEHERSARGEPFCGPCGHSRVMNIQLAARNRPLGALFSDRDRWHRPVEHEDRNGDQPSRFAGDVKRARLRWVGWHYFASFLSRPSWRFSRRSSSTLCRAFCSAVWPSSKVVPNKILDTNAEEMPFTPGLSLCRISDGPRAAFPEFDHQSGVVLRFFRFLLLCHLLCSRCGRESWPATGMVKSKG
jgi:hypothetical protein